jgi:hypothetical protein
MIRAAQNDDEELIKRLIRTIDEVRWFLQYMNTEKVKLPTSNLRQRLVELTKLIGAY